MATPGSLTHAQRVELKHSAEVLAGGSLGELIGGAGALVLGILGLAGILPQTLAAIGIICAGCAILFEGGAVAARFGKLLQETGASTTGEVELGGGMSAEALGGLGAVTLGLLALLEVAPMILMAVAILVLGGALMLGTTTSARLNDLTVESVYEDDLARRAAREALSTGNGAKLLTGAAGLVLGILALQGIAALTLVLVAVLSQGFATLLTGSALGGKMIALLRST